MAHAAEIVRPGDPPHVHHMDSNTAYHAAKFGMWLFLATEILLFGGLFCAFAIFRWMYLDSFIAASNELSVGWGATNTTILLISSFFAALALDAAQRGDNKKVVIRICVTLVCAVGFLIIKTIEYTGKYHHGLFPLAFGAEGKGFFDLHPNWNSSEMNHEFRCFFGLYYTMTMLHALHVIIGMAILGWVLTLARKNRFSERYYTPVELGALYWHLVDLIWIYLFPLLYLI